jgi:hypothetical protein
MENWGQVQSAQVASNMSTWGCAGPPDEMIMASTGAPSPLIEDDGTSRFTVLPRKLLSRPPGFEMATIAACPAARRARITRFDGGLMSIDLLR